MDNINHRLTQRLVSIDALRGLAVLLMMEQHLGAWLWKEPWTNLMKLLSEHRIFMMINGMGGFAAPLFLTLAGLGTSFLIHRDSNPDKKLAFRGAILIIYGYMLNALTPSWFSMGSWYALHMIGFAIVISPILRRLSSSTLVAIFTGLIIATVFIQNIFNTPFRFTNDYMADYTIPGGIFRIALAEGNFPIFPWLAFYITGMLSGKWLTHGKKKNILLLASCTTLTGLVLPLFKIFGSKFALSGPLLRFFILTPNYNPPFPPIILILIGLALFSIYIIVSIEALNRIRSTNPFVCLGQSSLTLLFMHIVIFKEISMYFNLYKIFTKSETFIVLFILLALFSALSVLWRKVHYKYGFEWLMRKLAG